jgi:peptidoglycan hydrolase-like protein with peptidoglycan-binding domain
MHYQIAVKPEDCHSVTYDGQVANEMRLPLRLGDVGEDVKYLQTKLIAIGFLPRTTPPKNHGTYDADTSAAVLAMRKSTGSSATSGDVYAADAAQQLDYAWSKFHATGEPGPPGPPGPSGTLTIKGDVTLP